MKHFHKGGANADEPAPTVLTEDEVQEVVTAYRDGMFVNDICNACNIVTTTLYNIVREAGVPLRTHTAQTEAAARRKAEWDARPRQRPRWPTRPTVDPLEVKRPPYLELERVRAFIEERNEQVSQSTAPVSNGKVEPAPANGVVSGLTEWVVTYTVTRTETTTVRAKDFNSAANAVHLEDDQDYEVISVARCK